MTAERWRGILDVLGAVAFGVAVWLRRGWLAARFFFVGVQAWCLVRRFIFRKGNEMEEMNIVGEKEGIKETLEVVKLGLAIGETLAKSLKDDGKLTLSDLPNFMALVGSAIPAVEDLGKIPAEIKDLSEAELGQIRDVVLAALPSLGAGDKWLTVAREALTIGVSAYKLITAFRN